MKVLWRLEGLRYIISRLLIYWCFEIDMVLSIYAALFASEMPVKFHSEVNDLFSSSIYQILQDVRFSHGPVTLAVFNSN